MGADFNGYLAPDYLSEFHCLASECPDTCCGAGWEIPIDHATCEFYSSSRDMSLYTRKVMFAQMCAISLWADRRRQRNRCEIAAVNRELVHRGDLIEPAAPEKAFQFPHIVLSLIFNFIITYFYIVSTDPRIATSFSNRFCISNGNYRFYDHNCFWINFCNKINHAFNG